MGEEFEESNTQVKPLQNNTSYDEMQGNTYVIRPNFQHKFRSAVVRDLIHVVLTENLSDKAYDAQSTTLWSKNIADAIRDKLQDMGYDRYKFVTQAVIAEQRGQGTRVVCRCFWDADCDSYAQDMYMNVSEMYQFSCMCLHTTRLIHLSLLVDIYVGG